MGAKLVMSNTETYFEQEDFFPTHRDEFDLRLASRFTSPITGSIAFAKTPLTLGTPNGSQCSGTSGSPELIFSRTVVGEVIRFFRKTAK